MLHEIKSTVLFSLLDTLKVRPHTTEAIAKALALVCTASTFEFAAVYEQTYFGFSLLEHAGVLPELLPKSFAPDAFSPQEQLALAEKSLHFITCETATSLFEQRLLATFFAECLLLIPFTGEEGRPYGFTLLASTSPEMQLTEEEQGIIESMLSLIVEATSSRSYRKRIAQTRESFENMVDNTGIDIYVNDLYTHDILYVNKSMAAPYGGQEMFWGKKCWQVLFPEQTGPCAFCPKNQLLDAQGRPEKVISWDYERGFDGSWFRVFSSSFYWGEGRLAHVVSSANITDNKRNEATIEYLANYDQLTNLPNRRMLLKDCDRRIDNATASAKGYVLFFDIDGFKAINDTLGHDAGDEFLIQLAAFFSEIPLLKGAIYRNGGDEFVALIDGNTISKEHIQDLARFIHDRFRLPWHLANGPVLCNTSIGVACYPEDGTTASSLLQKADQAMYLVKKAGGAGVQFGYQLCAERAHATL